MSQGFYSILLLIVSNVFMTFAWYGHLKLQEAKLINSWPLFGVILFSWFIALFEYCAQGPANRLGSRQWRTILFDAAKGDSRSDHSSYFHRFFYDFL